MPDWISVLKTLLEMGWPAIVTVAFYFLARQYMEREKQYMDMVQGEIVYLRQQVATLEAELISVKLQILESHAEDDN